MDEPTAALNAAEAERLFEVIREIRRSGRSVLYVSHRLDEVMRLCDRVTVLRDGAIVGTRPIAEVAADEIIRMMIGRQVGAAAGGRAGAAARTRPSSTVRDLAGAGVERISFALREGRDRRARRPRRGGAKRAPAPPDRGRTRERRDHPAGRRGRRPPGTRRPPGPPALPMSRASGARRVCSSRARSPRTSRCRIFAASASRGIFLARRRERAFAAARGSEVRLPRPRSPPALPRAERRQSAEGRLRPRPCRQADGAAPRRADARRRRRREVRHLRA